MMKKIKWNLWTISGAVVLAWIALLAVFAPGRICEPLMSEACRAQAWNYVGDAVWLTKLDQWQTLVGGVLAIIAALIGAWFINRQIVQADVHEKERWRRSMASARSMLPMTLSALMEYLVTCASELKNLRDACPGKVLPSGTPRPVSPSVPLSVAVSLQKMVEVSDEATGQPFADMLAQLQVLDARLRSVAESPANHLVLAVNIEDYILNVARIHAHAHCAFPFARRETDDVGTNDAVADQYVPAVRQLGFDEHDYGDLFKMAQLRAGRLRGDPEPTATPR